MESNQMIAGFLAQEEARRMALRQPSTDDLDLTSLPSRLPTGQRVAIDIDRVVTVLPKDYWVAAMDRRRTAQFETRT